jgi:hypothetical protein
MFGIFSLLESMPDNTPNIRRIAKCVSASSGSIFPLFCMTNSVLQVILSILFFKKI